jgi:phospholipid/cholesterol/gamma-HCH transport system ATP-binding protein
MGEKLAASSGPIVAVRDLSVEFGRQPVLRDINLSVRRGETLAIIGESGCGKTVLLKAMIGLVRPTRGFVEFDGKRLDRVDDKELTKLRTRFGFVFQNAALFDSMSVFENIEFPLREKENVSREASYQSVRELLSEVGLSENVLDKKSAELSGGMRKRVGLARALAVGPDVLLYDEPTTGLDPIFSDVINELIINTRKRREVTSIMVTHDMKSAQKVAKRIVMMYPLARLRTNEPQIIFDGTPQEIMNSRDPRVAQFVRGEAGERLKEMEQGLPS